MIVNHDRLKSAKVRNPPSTAWINEINIDYDKLPRNGEKEKKRNSKMPDRYGEWYYGD